jgi:diadenylate cyclase
VAVSFDTLTNLFERLGSDAYNWYVVAAELLLIGLMVNWCAGVLHGTRGTRLLRGLLVVLVAATLIVRVLADQLHWTRLGLLYQYFIIAMAFIALVAFQPELRRALMRAGDVRFMRRGSPRVKVLSALVEAAGYLSRNRYGALVAIQRDIGLTNWAENGTPLNAEVSANLLKTIFYPNSALHDLGVIIRGNRVVAAGCQFPVAESGEVDPSLGSRHRAAVGLSTESDALVLVVSEETGTISLADSGRLTRFLALDDLQDELESRMGERLLAYRRRRARGLSDVWRVARRLLVVAPLTLVIWFLADQASLVPAEGVEVALNIRHDDTVHVDLDQRPVFRIGVRGPRRQIEALGAAAREHPIRAEWSLPAPYARPGAQVLGAEQLREIIGDLPPLRERGVFVDSVSPSRFEFTVDEVAAAVMPVRVDAGSLELADARVEPTEVEVWLRRGDLESLHEAERVIEVEMEEALSTAPRNQMLRFSDVPLRRRVGEFEVLRVEPQVVDVSLRVVSERVRRSLERIPVRLEVNPQLLERYRVERADANEWLLKLDVEGDQTVVAALRPQQVRAFVPLTSDEVLPAGQFRSVEVVIDLPEGVTLIGPPRLVQVRLVPREGTAP